MSALALCMFSLVGTQPDKVESLNSPSPVWSRDVVEDLFGFRNEHKADWHKREFPGIVFLDNSRLLVYETDPTGELASRVSPDVSSSHTLHMSVLNPDSGKVLLTKNWPTRAQGSYILATSGGVMVRTGEILRLCSPDFVQIRDVPLSHSNGYERWEFRVSASRRTVLVQHNTQSSTQLQVLDGSTFEVRRTWTEPRFYQATFSISDDEMIRMIEPTRREHQLGVIVTKFGSEDWKPVLWRPLAKTCSGAPWFVTNDLVMFGCTEVVLFTKESEVLMTDHLDKDDYPMLDMTSLAAAPSENGNFAAVPVSHILGIAWDADHVTARYVMVYNLSRRARVLTVGITPLTKVHHAIALSPDGSKLAILNDRQVSVYSVPIN
jgi:hypothetical protein